MTDETISATTIINADFRAGCSAQSCRVIAAAADGSQRPDLLERYCLLIMVSVGGSAIRVPDGAKPICYLP